MATIYVLDCQLTIGNVVLRHTSSVHIESSIKSLSDTATVVLPRAIAQWNRKQSLLETISIGNSIDIQLGYNGQLYSEFEGYVKNISSTEPLELECEDEMYILRQRTLPSKHYVKVTVSTLLREVVQGYALRVEIDFELHNYRIPSGKTVYEVLLHLKENFPIDFYFKSKVLYATWAYSIDPKLYKTYHLEKNVVKNDLKYIVASAKKVRVKATSTLANGKKLQVEWGEQDAPLITLPFAHIQSEEELLRLAQVEVAKRKQAGFEGKIIGFGFPRTHAGEGLEIQSDKYPDRAGKYLIDKLVIEWSEKGYRRENEISKKISR